jgi:hypothetical protein
VIAATRIAQRRVGGWVGGGPVPRRIAGISRVRKAASIIGIISGRIGSA